MPTRGFLTWLDGQGWLILSGGDSDGSPLRAQALTRADASGGALYISLADDEGESLHDDFDDLGAPSGYVLDLNDEVESMHKQMREASIIVIEGGDSLDEAYEALSGKPLEGLRAAYERGTVILFEGLAVNLMGKWAMTDEGEILEGIEWLTNAFIEPGVASVEDSPAIQAILLEEDSAIGVAIGEGSALAFGGLGQLEAWGDEDIVVALGRAYQKQLEEDNLTDDSEE